MKMNWRFFMALFGLAGIAGAALLLSGSAGHQDPPWIEVALAAEERTDKSSGPPPLVIDKDAPLLLDEPTEPDEASSAETAQASAHNSACFVCHANYQEERLASDHAKAGVGCVNCHGESYPHRNDENNTTPPDIMYPAERIDLSCHKCHATHDVPAAEVIALWLKCCPAKTDPKTIVCTNCHGGHRLKLRTVRWDKKTGKLIRRGDEREEKHQKPGPT